MGYNLLINWVYWGYNPFTNHLLTSWDIQVPTVFEGFGMPQNNLPQQLAFLPVESLMRQLPVAIGKAWPNLEKSSGHRLEVKMSSKSFWSCKPQFAKIISVNFQICWNNSPIWSQNRKDSWRNFTTIGPYWRPSSVICVKLTSPQNRLGFFVFFIPCFSTPPKKTWSLAFLRSRQTPKPSSKPCKGLTSKNSFPYDP